MTARRSKPLGAAVHFLLFEPGLAPRPCPGSQDGRGGQSFPLLFACHSNAINPVAKKPPSSTSTAHGGASHLQRLHEKGADRSRRSFCFDYIEKPRLGVNLGLSRSTFVHLRRVSADPYSGNSHSRLVWQSPPFTCPRSGQDVSSHFDRRHDCLPHDP
jgi:hypothetical protein